ncbi:MAG: DUF87 domain-containing protein [Planctomycetota bacterium]
MTDKHRINLGQDDLGGPVYQDLDSLMRSRMLIQGASGSGKSYLARGIVEQAAHHVPVIVIDPEGEYATLRELHPMLLVGHGQAVDVPADINTAAALAKRLNENKVSAVLDLSELPLHQRRGFVRRYIEGLMAVPAKKRQPAIVLGDEAHKFAAQSDRCESLEAMADLSSRGRKRKLCLIAATQRISKFHNDVAAELKNRLIGGTTLDVDVKRAGDELGMTTKDRRVLTTLPAGAWYGFGPAFEGRRVYEFVGAEVQTTHEDAALVAVPPASPDIQAIASELADLAERHQDDVTTIEEAESVINRLKKDKGRLERQLEAANNRPPEIDEAEVQRRVFEASNEVGNQLKRQIIESIEQMVIDDPTPSRACEPRPIRCDIPPSFVPERYDPVDGVSRPQQKILDTLAWFSIVGIDQPSKDNVAAVAGVSPTSGGYKNNLGKLRSMELLDYPASGSVALTDSGRKAARYPDAPPTLKDLHRAWLGSRALSNPQATLLEVLIGAYPSAMARQDLADRVGNTVTSGGFKNNLGRLRSLGLIGYPSSGEAVATELLFPEGLF